MIPASGQAGRRVGVLGLGRSGLTVARALAAGGAQVLGWDDGEAARTAAAAAGIALADLSRPREAGALDLLVVSPGIPHLYPAPHPAVARALALGVPVDNDIGLFCAGWPALAAAAEEEGDGPAPRLVCITGSNGKSTTTALVAHILNAAGRPAQMGGNIGRGVFDLDPPAPGGAVVLELSSYQTELARILCPDIAVFLNISPDHLDRHGGMGGYFAAKRRLIEAGAPVRAVIGVDETEGLFLAGRTDAEALITVSASRPLRGPGWSVSMHRGHLGEWRGGRQVAAADLRGLPALTGSHNHQNACAAWAVARALGLGPRAIEAGLASFAGLPHRMEPLGRSRGGVLWVNDSKATNADAAARALASYDRIRWIAGGRAKEGGIAALAPHFPRIVRAYLIGEAQGPFAADLGEVAHRLCNDLEHAVAAAAAEAQPGEVILLSPAAASFDQFRDFEHRGAAFRALAAPHLEGPP